MEPEALRHDGTGNQPLGAGGSPDEPSRRTQARVVRAPSRSVPELAFDRQTGTAIPFLRGMGSPPGQVSAEPSPLRRMSMTSARQLRRPRPRFEGTHLNM
jgi:hypothetical protein